MGLNKVKYEYFDNGSIKSEYSTYLNFNNLNN